MAKLIFKLKIYHFPLPENFKLLRKIKINSIIDCDIFKVCILRAAIIFTRPDAKKMAMPLILLSRVKAYVV